MNYRSEAAVSKPWLRFRAGLLIGFLLAFGMASRPAGAQEQAQQPPPGLPLGPVVNAPAGPVQGINNNGVYGYLGIPYAQPPVGALRWQPPQPLPPWTHTRNATQFGPTCAQITTTGVFSGPPSSNEDCLFLNVFTPNPQPSGKLPVLVWLHGGGNYGGESNDYDASKLASQGGLVVVSLNYRVGFFGFLANPALNSEGHPFGNYGLLDQQLVLKWVKDNIASFGGDPGRVTLGGQSAGSFDTAANVVSPLAAGLFNRAIFQSVVLDSLPLPAAERIGTAVSVATGCGPGATPEVAACLRSLPAEAILAVQGTEAATSPLVVPLTIADGTILPSRGVFDAFRTGKFNHMPILSGFVHDEANFFEAPQVYYSGKPISEEDVTNYVQATYGADAPKVLAAFNPSSYPTPQLALVAIRTPFYICPQFTINKAISSQVPFYAYQFNDETAPSYTPPLPDFEWLAYHTGDIQYLFPGFHGGPKGIPQTLNRQQKVLSDQLVAFWSNFARTGNPNLIGNWPWPRYDASHPWSSYYLSQDIPVLSWLRDAQISEENKCDFFAGLAQPFSSPQQR